MKIKKKRHIQQIETVNTLHDAFAFVKLLYYRYNRIRSWAGRPGMGKDFGSKGLSIVDTYAHIYVYCISTIHFLNAS